MTPLQHLSPKSWIIVGSNLSHPRPSASSSSPTALGISPIDVQSYHEMLYYLCGQNLPPGHLNGLSSATLPSPSSLCLSPGCPVQITHTKGLFTYMGVPNDWELKEYDFGASNPPRDIWFARHRIMHETGSYQDYHMVNSFIEYRYVPKETPQPGYTNGDPSPSVTNSADHDTHMAALTEEIAGVAIDASNPGNGAEETSPHLAVDADRPQPPQRSASPTESETDAEMERHLHTAYFEMELQDAEERAAQMNITEGAGTAAQEPEDTPSHSADEALQHRVEVAYMTCVAAGELAP